MAKRVAEEYITKDKGSTPNFEEGGPVKMATPAQMAARKLKTPRSRLGPRGKSFNSPGSSSTGASAPNPFAQLPQAFAGLPNASFTFGAPSQVGLAQYAETAPSTFSTSQSTPSIFSSSQSAPSTFSFGQPPQTNGTFSFGSNSNTHTTQPAQPTFAFGQQSQTNGTTSSFGSNNQTVTAPSAPSKFSFGQPSQTNGTSSSFDSTNQLDPAPSALSKFSFGQPATTNSAFGGFKFGTSSQHALGAAPSGQSAPMQDTMMFSPPRKTATEQPETSSVLAQAAAPVEAPKALFQFQSPAAPKTTSSLAAAPTSAPFGAYKPYKPLFQFQAPVVSQALSSIDSAQTSTSTASSQPVHFQASSEPLQSSYSAPAPTFAPAEPPKQIFQFQTPGEPHTNSSRESAQKSTPTETSQPLPEIQTPDKQVMPDAASYDTTKQMPQEAPKSFFQFQAPTEQTKSSAATVEGRTEAQTHGARPVDRAPVEFEKVKLRSNGPSELLLTDDHSKWTEHDRQYRLRSLNKELVRRLGLYDPGSQDFDNVIIYYYQMREKLGLLWPSTARKTKRKADDEETPAVLASPAKKAKTSEPADDNSNPISNVFSMPSSSNVGAPTQQPGITSAASNTSPPASLQGSFGSTPAVFQSGPSKPHTGPSSGTSTLFQSMLSASSGQAGPNKPKSTFAHSSAQPLSTAKPMFSFAQSGATNVTSPTKPVSPPTSNEMEDEGDAEEQGSEEEHPTEGEDEEQDLEGSNKSGDDNNPGEADEDADEEEDDIDYEEPPATKPEDLGKSLFDRIQPPAPASGESVVKTPDGVQDKTTSKQPAPNHSFKPFTPFPPGINMSTPQAPTVSPITPFGRSVKSKPATTFDFTSKEAEISPTPVPGASIFAGGSVKSSGPIPGEGLFGSRPSTPVNDQPASTNIFASFGQIPNTTADPAKDNTWTKGSPLRFSTPQKSMGEGSKVGGASATNFMTAFGKNAEEHAVEDKKRKRYEDLGSDAEEDEIAEWEKEYEEKHQAKRAKASGASAFGQGGFKPSVAAVATQAEKQTTPAPSFNVTAATPPPKGTAGSEHFTNLFGQKSDTAPPVPPATDPVGFTFGTAPSGASALQPAASYLFPSANTSGLSSRATSPGVTDNESNGTDGEADANSDPQTSLMSDRAGEENEEVLYEARTKALRFMDKAAAAERKGATPDAFNSVGLGILRVLKNRGTNKARIVIRAEPGANILLNTHLVPFINYTNDPSAEGSGVVRFGVPLENGKIEQWVLKVKNSKKAGELAEILTHNKS